MAAAVVEMSARDACVMAPTGATHHMSAAEMAASGVATPEMAAAATPHVAATSEVAAAASEMARKRGHRRAGCGNAEQQRCDDPNKSRVRRTHSSSPRRAAAILRPRHLN
jgi:flagellar biosynthesis/type III secretory pathway M-ring protein FliF/YscJ